MTLQRGSLNNFRSAVRFSESSTPGCMKGEKSESIVIESIAGSGACGTSGLEAAACGALADRGREAAAGTGCADVAVTDATPADVASAARGIASADCGSMPAGFGGTPVSRGADGRATSARAASCLRRDQRRSEKGV